MSKNKKKISVCVPHPMAGGGISNRGKKIIAAGVGMLVLGYALLTQTDPAGQNIPSLLSPFLIIGGYSLIGIGIIFPAPGASAPPFQ